MRAFYLKFVFTIEQTYSAYW